MLAYLKYGIILSALTATFASHAKAITIDCDPSLTACGISFTTIPATPSLSAGVPVTSDPYIITNVGSTSVTLASVVAIRQADDTVGTSGVTIDPSSTCTASTVLTSSATCEIVLDFAPAYGGLLDWNLIVTPESTQRPLSLNISTTVSGSPAPTAQIGVGYYGTSTPSYYPLISTSNDGTTWDNVIDSSSQPNNIDLTIQQGASFYDGVCSYGTCVAVGNYQSTVSGGIIYPMIASNAGTDWSYKVQDAQAPSDVSIQGTLLTSVDCYQNLCLAVGYYYDASFNQYGLAYRSTDGGYTWTIILDSTNSATVGASQLTLSQCTQANSGTCFATIANGSNTGGLIQISSTGGISVVDPGTLYSYIVRFFDCPTSLSCAGLGTLNVHGTGTQSIPNEMIIYTTDGGNTWSQTDVTSGMLPTADNVVFQALGCATNGQCVFAGTYLTSGSNYLWASIGTIGAGFSDTSPVLDNSSNPSDLDPTGSQQGVSSATCTIASSTQCILTGQYPSNSGGDPVYPFIGLIVSGTPSFPVDSSFATPTNYTNYAYAADVVCNGLSCVTTGSYNVTGGNSSPYALLSTNGGTTWSYTVQSGEELPSDLVTGAYVSLNNE